MARILIVEDDADTQYLLGQVLERQGYHVTNASNGWEALLEVDKSAFDLILLDIMMPGLDGAKFLSILRNYAARSAVPVLIVTALDRSEALARIRPHAPDGVVEKKGDDFFDDLLTRVQKLLGPPAAAGP
jgi:two-component system, sensor histidine kinase and response regulator